MDGYVYHYSAIGDDFIWSNGYKIYDFWNFLEGQWKLPWKGYEQHSISAPPPLPSPSEKEEQRTQHADEPRWGRRIDAGVSSCIFDGILIIDWKPGPLICIII